MSAREPFTSWWGREGMKVSLATQLILCLRGPTAWRWPFVRCWSSLVPSSTCLCASRSVFHADACLYLEPTEEVCLQSSILRALGLCQETRVWVCAHRLMHNVLREESPYAHEVPPPPACLPGRVSIVFRVCFWSWAPQTSHEGTR